MIVCGAGTGGTITGIARKLKEKLPNIIVVGVDPYGSILGGNPEITTSYQVEGIGYDFFPDVLDVDLIDKWIKTEDKPSFQMARRLIKEEGLLCGGSSGTAVYAAIEAAKELKEGQRCVVLLPDSIRNYIFKFVDDRWMYDYGFYEPEDPKIIKKEETVSSISNFSNTLKALPTIPCLEALQLLKDNNMQHLPLVNDDGTVNGLVNSTSLINYLIDGGNPDDEVKNCELATFRKLEPDFPLNRARFSLLKNDGAAIICTKNDDGKYVFQNLLTETDLVNHLTQTLTNNNN